VVSYKKKKNPNLTHTKYQSYREDEQQGCGCGSSCGSLLVSGAKHTENFLQPPLSSFKKGNSAFKSSVKLHFLAFLIKTPK
jgi:hypothetical protein